MKTLYVSDLDGTLLHENRRLPEETAQRIRRLIEWGMNFTIATARSLETAGEYIEALGITLPAVLGNGVFLYDPVAKRNLKCNYIETTNATEILTWFESDGLHPIVHTFSSAGERKAYWSSMDNPSITEYISWRLKAGDKRFTQIDSYAGLLKNTSAVIINLIGRPDDIRYAYEKLSTIHQLALHYYSDIYCPEYMWLEIADKHAQKGLAVRSAYEISGCNRLVVFGDNTNDISMFKVAHEGYAVCNADSTLLPYATDIIGSNLKDGVVDYLEKQFLDERQSFKIAEL